MTDDSNALPTGKPHVSYNEWKTWAQCSYKHKLKYIDKIDIEERGVETILGSAFHDAVESRLRGLEPDVVKLRELIAEELSRVTDVIARDRFDVETCVSRALEMSTEGVDFLSSKFPGWKLLEAEENLYESMQLNESKHPDVSFKGYVDLVFEAADGKVWIVDWKTAARPWGREKLSDPKVTYQLSMYKNFWAAKHGAPLDNVRCAYFVGLKKSKPGKTFNMIPISVGPTTSSRTLTVLNNFVSSVKRGMTIKNKSEQNCRWCEYRQTKWCP